ncbi:MAG: hypothetical protein ACHQX1_01910 [Candidatus Micrarchaeales archaeon]
MAYNSYYKREQDDAVDSAGGIEEQDKQQNKKTSVSIEEPMALWVGLLVIGALLQLVAIPFAVSYQRTMFNTYFNDFANFVVYIPGIFVLPLIVALWIGEKVSYLSEKILYKGLIHGIYASVVYAATITIIYFIMELQHTGVLANVGPLRFLEYVIIAPFVISIVVTPLFAKLSAERRR